MKKTTHILLLALAVALLASSAALAQETQPAIEISLSRDFGYGGFSGDIQGTFSIHVKGPDTLQEVRFYLDDTLLGSDTSAPFSLQFLTDNFEPGVHDIYAIGVLADGTELRSETITPLFLSNEEAGDMVTNLVVPILLIILVVTIIGVGVPLLFRKGKPGPIGQYSIAGGAVCPRCTFPYSRHVLSPNMVFGKLERCPHCGKYAIVRAATAFELNAAEERLRASQQETSQVQVDEKDTLRRALDESRFDE